MTTKKDIFKAVSIAEAELTKRIRTLEIQSDIRYQEISQSLVSILNALSLLVSKQPHPTEDGELSKTAHKPERKAIRLAEAKKSLGGYCHKSFRFLLNKGAEGYRNGNACYIYEDSIPKIKKGVKVRREGLLSLQAAARRWETTYQDAKAICRARGFRLRDIDGIKFLRTVEVESVKCN